MNRELDALVAEKVMGWTLVTDIVKNCSGQWFDSNGGGTRSEHGWHPDTSISDAWLVVEEMRKRGFGVNIVSPNVDTTSQPRPTDWIVWVEREDGVSSVASWRCDSAPEALCRAALEAVK